MAKSKTTRAMEKLREAAYLREDGRPHNRMAAVRLEDEANALLAPVVAEIALGEVVPSFDEDKSVRIVDTLENPTCVATDASARRLELLSEAGLLELALDICDSIRAGNALERMLSYQMAGACAAALRLHAMAQNEDLPPVEVCRLLNAAARQSDTFQGLLLTLEKLRRGNTQKITVQHVHVNDGGHAMVVAPPRNAQVEGEGGGPHE
jgi:hypothetical protein